MTFMPTSPATHNTALFAIGAFIFGLAGGYGMMYAWKQQHPSITEKRCTLRTAMRKLWADHVFWTRNYIISAIAKLDDLKAATDRLLQNQQDIGSAFAGYYGKEAGDKTTALLRDHILIAADLVKAAIEDNKEAFANADERWHMNAHEIATFLSSANPAWDKQEMVAMFNNHLKLTTQEAALRLKKEWVEDVKNFDLIFDQAEEMADQLTAGIAQQFPTKF